MNLVMKRLKSLKMNSQGNNLLIDLSKELMSLRDGDIYEWELLITYPAVNMSVNLIDGIKQLVKQNNFVGCYVSNEKPC